MKRKIIEIKARSKEHGKVRDMLKREDAEFRGTDHQVDTYFKVGSGRLKLREGDIENHLIYYAREDKRGPKQSDVMLTGTEPGSSLREMLAKALGILVVVDKKREIYFMGNVKFHLDTVEGLGEFVEIEAIDDKGDIGREKLLAQCSKYMKKFGIDEKDLVSGSYSDMLMEKA